MVPTFEARQTCYMLLVSCELWCMIVCARNSKSPTKVDDDQREIQFLRKGKEGIEHDRCFIDDIQIYIPEVYI